MVTIEPKEVSTSCRAVSHTPAHVMLMLYFTAHGSGRAMLDSFDLPMRRLVCIWQRGLRHSVLWETRTSDPLRWAATF